MRLSWQECAVGIVAIATGGLLVGFGHDVGVAIITSAIAYFAGIKVEEVTTNGKGKS